MKSVVRYWKTHFSMTPFFFRQHKSHMIILPSFLRSFLPSSVVQSDMNGWPPVQRHQCYHMISVTWQVACLIIHGKILCVCERERGSVCVCVCQFHPKPTSAFPLPHFHIIPHPHTRPTSKHNPPPLLHVPHPFSLYLNSTYTKAKPQLSPHFIPPSSSSSSSYLTLTLPAHPKFWRQALYRVIYGYY